MARVKNSDIVSQLTPLIARYRELQNKSAYNDLSDFREDTRVLVGRLHAAFHRLLSPSSTYANDAEGLRGKSAHSTVHSLVALAQGLVDDINDGWDTTLVALVHADTQADLIEMAQSLLQSGYKDASAVVIGTALELHLKAMATACQISLRDSKGRPIKVDTIKSELRKMEIFSAVREKQITYWLGVRNSAAHGSYGDYAKDDVSMMIDGVATFVEQHAA